MISLSTTVTQADLTAAEAVIRTTLQEQDSTLDLSAGGAVDGLLSHGNAIAAASITVEANKLALSSQLQAIAAGTVTVEDADLDQLMTSYFLTRKTASAASGTITVIVNSNQQYNFVSGYRWKVGSSIYQTTGQVTVYPVGTVLVENANQVVLKQVYDSVSGALYRFDISVTSQTTGSNAGLSTNDSLSPDPGFSGFARAYAATNFSVGQSAETNAQFATRALAGLSAKVLVGNDGLSALLPTLYTNAYGSFVGADDVLQTRDRQNVFNISTGGKADLYVKSGPIATKTILVTATVTDYTTRTAQITLTRAQASGAYRFTLEPYFTSTPPSGITGSVSVTATTHNAYTYTSGFNPALPASTDRAFSANQEVVLTFTDTRTTGSYVVSMTTNGQVISNTYAVTVEYMPGVEEIAAALRADSIRPAATDILVKAAVPLKVTLGVTCSRPVTYTGPDEGSIEISLAALINSLSMRTANLDQYVIGNLIKSINSSLTVTSLSMSGVIYAQDGTNVTVLQGVNGLVIPTDSTKKYSSNNVFFTTTSNDVTVTLA